MCQESCTQVDFIRGSQRSLRLIVAAESEERHLAFPRLQSPKMIPEGFSG